MIRGALVLIGVVAALVFVFATHWRYPGVAGLIAAVFAGVAAAAGRGWSSREEYGDHHHDDD